MFVGRPSTALIDASCLLCSSEEIYQWACLNFEPELRFLNVVSYPDAVRVLNGEVGAVQTKSGEHTFLRLINKALFKVNVIEDDAEPT